MTREMFAKFMLLGVVLFILTIVGLDQVWQSRANKVIQACSNDAFEEKDPLNKLLKLEQCEAKFPGSVNRAEIEGSIVLILILHEAKISYIHEALSR